MNRLFLGIDLGTSTMKLVLMNEEREVIAQIREDYAPASLHQGWSEIDPNIWYECMKKGIRRILEKQNATQIVSIGVTGQMHTLTIIDREGNSIRPAIMWNDIRSKKMIAGLKATICAYPEGDYLSQTISTGCPASSLYWISREEPDNFSKIHKFLMGPDYLVYRLTGCCGTDYCGASTSCLYRNRAKVWSAEIRDLIGLEDTMYPELRGSAVQAGFIKQELAMEFGFREDVDVLTGTGDNPATAISAGCISNNYPVISLGTSGVLMMKLPDLASEAKGKRILFSYDGTEILTLVQGAIQSNGSSLEWWLKKITRKNSFDDIDNKICLEKVVDNKVMFYPHLIGDKTIYADPDIRGAFLGLSAETDEIDMLYALIEGLCFAFRELAENMNFDFLKNPCIRVLGGGANSRVWMQILANVFDIRIEQLNRSVGPAMGIALLAAYHSGYMDSPEYITHETVGNYYEPQREYMEIYQEKYARYLRIHKGLGYIFGGKSV